MKSFFRIAAQGEITIRRVESVPKGCTTLQAENGKFVIGHSETGHNHVIDAAAGTVSVLKKVPEGMRILYAILKEPTSLEHLREFDKHDAIALEPGIYEFRIAREYDPYAELARRAAD